MEVGTTQSKTAVNANAKPAEAMPKLQTGGTPATYEDLGGPTPENYKVDDDSAKFKEPGASLSQVKDVITKNAKSGVKPGDVQPGAKLTNVPEEVEADESEEKEVVAEQEVSTEETVEEETVAEEEAPSKLREKMKEAIEASDSEEVVAESQEEEAEELDVSDDINALVAGEELSEEFQEKAKTIFEAAINSKVAKIEEALEADHVKALTEEVAEFKNELTERVDSYLEYVASEWMQENQLAVDQGLKGELSESFMTGLK